jgi:hypothetical protein
MFYFYCLLTTHTLLLPYFQQIKRNVHNSLNFLPLHFQTGSLLILIFLSTQGKTIPFFSSSSWQWSCESNSFSPFLVLEPLSFLNPSPSFPPLFSFFLYIGHHFWQDHFVIPSFWVFTFPLTSMSKKPCTLLVVLFQSHSHVLDFHVAVSSPSF